MVEALYESAPLQYDDGIPLCPPRKQHVLHALSMVGTEQGQVALAEYMRDDALHDEDEWTACMLNLMVDLHRVRDPTPVLFEEVRRRAYPDSAHARDVGSRRAREDSVLAPPAVLVLGSMGHNSAQSSHPELHDLVGSLLTSHLKNLLAADEKYKRDRDKFEAMAMNEYESSMPHMQLRYLQHTLNLHGIEFHEAWATSAEEDKDLWRNHTLTWMADQVRSHSESLMCLACVCVCGYVCLCVCVGVHVFRMADQLRAPTCSQKVQTRCKSISLALFRTMQTGHVNKPPWLILHMHILYAHAAIGRANVLTANCKTYVLTYCTHAHTRMAVARGLHGAAAACKRPGCVPRSRDRCRPARHGQFSKRKQRR
jgi:hypothetical protein